MKNKLFKIAKWLVLGFATLAMFVAIAFYWPMPALPTPFNNGDMVLKNVHVIDVHTGEVQYDQNLYLRSGRIVKIDGDQVQKSDITVVETGGKFVVPGLWDMHTHSTQLSPWLHHPLYIANGVTGIRDMSGQLGRKDSYWAGTPDRLAWAKEMEANQRLTPLYVQQSSYQINGAGSVPEGFPAFFKAESEKQVLELLQYYQQEGTDFIKVYAEIKADSYAALMQHADGYGLKVAGHKPLNVPLETCIRAGQQSFEHGRIFMFECFPGAKELRDSDNKGATFGQLKSAMVHDFDSLKASYLMALMKKYNAHWTPTLQTVKMSAKAHENEFVNSPYLRYVPSMRQSLWWNPDLQRSAEANQKSALNQEFYAAVATQIKMADAMGVQMLVGTDVTDTYVFPGFSLHDELVAMQQAGRSNLSILRSATIVAATFSGREKDYGSVEVGKKADLLLLDANPLDDIAHSKSIHAVVLNGALYNKEVLEEMQTSTEALASTLHLNVKFVISLLSSPLIRNEFAD